ncbi:MAG: hypothetical protein CBB87_05270 [Micavibrio sp. TMED27]|nr:hypothetical protein [Micavibrio sp.]OUT91436.1 MAG: hypothetical protein CBB87_05270 [Micavibrio sp. TMED27]|tara:strand:+ start:379 stop:561 length:183 start_codon:yes stop_codon:yes gene_type:complete
MKKFSTTLCILGTAAALSACGTTYDSGSSYATDRTAGNANVAKPVMAAPAERVFQEVQMK